MRLLFSFLWFLALALPVAAQDFRLPFDLGWDDAPAAAVARFQAAGGGAEISDGDVVAGGLKIGQIPVKAVMVRYNEGKIYAVALIIEKGWPGAADLPAALAQKYGPPIRDGTKSLVWRFTNPGGMLVSMDTGETIAVSYAHSARTDVIVKKQKDERAKKLGEVGKGF